MQSAVLPELVQHVLCSTEGGHVLAPLPLPQIFRSGTSINTQIVAAHSSGPSNTTSSSSDIPRIIADSQAVISPRCTKARPHGPCSECTRKTAEAAAITNVAASSTTPRVNLCDSNTSAHHSCKEYSSLAKQSALLLVITSSAGEYPCARSHPVCQPCRCRRWSHTAFHTCRIRWCGLSRHSRHSRHMSAIHTANVTDLDHIALAISPTTYRRGLGASIRTCSWCLP